MLMNTHAFSLGSITTLKRFKATRVALRVAKYSSWLNPNLSAMPKVVTGFYAVCKGRKVGVFTDWYAPLVVSCHV